MISSIIVILNIIIMNVTTFGVYWRYNMQSCTVAHLPSGVWIIFTIELNSSGSFRWLWWNDSLGLASNRIPSGTDIPSLFNMFSARRSAWNAESGILPPKYGNTFSRNSWRFCCEQSKPKTLTPSTRPSTRPKQNNT